MNNNNWTYTCNCNLDNNTFSYSCFNASYCYDNIV